MRFCAIDYILAMQFCSLGLWKLRILAYFIKQKCQFAWNLLLHKLRESYQTNGKFARRHGAVTSDARLWWISKAPISTTQSDNYQIKHACDHNLGWGILSKSEPNKMNTHKNFSPPCLTNLNDTQNLFSNATVTFDEKVSNRKYPEVRSEVESVASDPHHGPAGPHSWIFFSSKRRAFNHLPLFHWEVRVYIVVRLGFHTYGALVEGHNSRVPALCFHLDEMSCVLTENYIDMRIGVIF